MAHKAVSSGRWDLGLPFAFSSLNLARRALPRAEWLDAVEQIATPHPFTSIVMQDPMAQRALQKPRGYAGDAVLLDYLYRLRRDDILQASEAARIVHQFLVEGPAPRAVRHRLGVLAEALGRVGRCKGRALAIASGHLRELALVPRDERPSHVVALDQDPESLAVVASSYPEVQVVARRGTVRDVLARRFASERFNLVYAAGLLDYLAQPVATMLASRMLELLSPGGTLLLANFTPDTPDIGFIEAMLDWHLVYRTEADMGALLEPALQKRSVATMRTWRDPDGCIVYLSVETKAGSLASTF